MYERQIRLALLTQLDITRLRLLAKSVDVDLTATKHFDLALSVAVLPWKPGARIVWEFSQIFGISDHFLPTRDTSHATVELLEPDAPLGTLLGFQQEVFAASTDRVKRDPGACFLVQMPTGAGKTRTASEVLVKSIEDRSQTQLRTSALWLAHSEELCDQAADTIARVWRCRAITDTRLIRLWGSAKIRPEEMLRSITIASFAKIPKIEALFSSTPNTCWSIFGLLVIDEAHRALAPSVAPFIEQAKSMKDVAIIGLTATPGRSSDNRQENNALAKLFNKNLVKPASLGPDPYQRLVDDQVLSRVRHRDLETGIEVQEFEDDDIDVSPSLLRQLANNERRNKIIVDALIEYLVAGRRAIVYACSVEHAHALSAALCSRGYPSASISADLRSSTRRAFIDDFRAGRLNAICNFGVLSTGFDAPAADVVVISRPTTSVVLYSQMIGRGLRGPKFGGTGDCIVIDVKDNFAAFGGPGRVYDYFSRFWREES